MDGLTLPGMIEEPGWTAGRMSSPKPVRGPETMRRMSFAMLESSIAAVRMPLEIRTNAAVDCIAAKRSAAGTIGSPVHSARYRHTRERYSGSALSPVPAAVPPIPSSQSSVRPAPSRAAADRIRTAQPPNSWPNVMGTASWRCVRPGLTTLAYSAALAANASPSASSSALTAFVRSRSASRMAVGVTSFVDWDMFTWSFGLTVAYSPRLPAPRISFARLAMTSLAFMLWDVPAPAWKTSTTNWSRCLPARISSHAATIARQRSWGSRPDSAFAIAAAFFTSTVARMNAGNGRKPEIGKFSTARVVCAPYRASAGTATSPSVSRSRRVDIRKLE